MQYDGQQVVRIEAVEGDTVLWRDELGPGRSSKESFLRVYPKLAPAGTVLAAVVEPDGNFTIRDEANALTAVAFRSGFIEELHAGKRSPLLEQPGYSRITDDEMRRLMIEASEKLARMLRLKRSHPRKYEAEIRRCHESYCRK